VSKKSNGKNGKNGKNGGDTKVQIIDGLTEIRIVGTYLTQKLTFPTVRELQAAALEHLSAKINLNSLKRAMQGAASAGFIAIHKKQDPDGLTVTAYKMKDLSWKKPPEFAHILDLLPVLLDTPEAREIKDWFDKQEGEGSKKKRRGNDIADYVFLQWDCVTTDYLLGSQIQCQSTDLVRKKFPTDIEKNKVEVEGIWVRCPLTGDFIITQDVLQGWFASNALRYMNLPESRAAYISFTPVRITPTSIEQMMLPVMSNKGPSAPKSYEALPPGQEFQLNMLAPIKGVLTIEDYEKVVLTAGLRPKRGISPARGRRHGRFLVTAFRNLGRFEECGVEHLTPDIPKPLMERHGSYYYEAIERLKAKPGQKFDPGEFPRVSEFEPSDDAQLI